MGVWPAARTSNGRLCACCVMDCWPVRWCGLRRPAVGTQVKALQLGSSRTQHFPTFEKFVVASIFWPFGTAAINLDNILCLLKFPEATFDGGHVCSSQPNILKTYAPHYTYRCRTARYVYTSEPRATPEKKCYGVCTRAGLASDYRMR